MKIKSSSFISQVEGLRGLAIAFVVLNHVSSDLFIGGYLGVDIFFVISGFVIMRSCLARREAALSRPSKFKEFLLDFYHRRITRIIPSLFVYVVVTILFFGLLVPEPRTLLSLARAALMGFSNITLFRSNFDYFSESNSNNPFLQTWSLGIEEQFYLVFPLMLVLAGYFSSRYCERLLRRRLLGINLVIGFVSLAGAVSISRYDTNALFFLPQYRAWELSAGSCIAIVLSERLSRFKLRDLAIIVSTSIFILLFSLFLFDSDFFEARIIVVIATCLIIFASCLNKSGRLVGKVLDSRLLRYLGKISYSLYLWHWFVVCAFAVVGVSHGLIAQSIGLVLSISLSIFLYTFVEVPCRRFRFSVSKPSQIVAASVCFVFPLGLFSYVLRNRHIQTFYIGNRAYLSEANKPIMQSHTFSDGSTDYFWDSRLCMLSEDMRHQDLLDNLNSGLCLIKAVSPRVQKTNVKSSKRLIVIGNSYLPSLIQSLRSTIALDELTITAVGSLGASGVPGMGKPKSPWEQTNDFYWKKIIPRLISDLRAGDQILIVADLSDVARQIKKEGDSISNEVQDSYERFLSKLDEAVDILSVNAIGVTSFYGCDYNAFLYSPLKVLLSNNCNGVDYGIIQDKFKGIDSVQAEIVSRYPNFRTINIRDSFCRENICDYTDKVTGKLLYRDKYGHPSVAASQLLETTIYKSLLRAPE